MKMKRKQTGCLIQGTGKFFFNPETARVSVVEQQWAGRACLSFGKLALFASTLVGSLNLYSEFLVQHKCVVNSADSADMSTLKVWVYQIHVNTKPPSIYILFNLVYAFPK